MKNLIVYATKHGTVKKCAEMLKAKLNGETVLANVNDEVLDLEDFDTVILGGSIHIGKIQKKLYNYAEDNLNQLLKKKVALFICSGEDNPEYITASFPEGLLNHAVSKQLFGGELILENLNFFTRFLMRRIMKIKNGYSRIKESNISELADNINEE
jgi:menaquinone-dependent protoporphyrinogen oxidase